jgi:hypothetical protein
MNIPAARLSIVRPLTSRNSHARTGLTSDGRWTCNPATASDSTGEEQHQEVRCVHRGTRVCFAGVPS